MTLARVLSVPAGFVLSARAHACTVRDSPNGHQLRAGLFSPSFLHILLLVAAPVPVFAAALLLLHFGMPDLHASEPGLATAPVRAE